jgi:4'-phosphopantetheinyl transferase
MPMTAAPQHVAVAATTEAVLAAVADAGRLLTEAERGRAAAFRFDRDRDDFVAAHVLARASAAAIMGVPADRLTWLQRCPECGGPHGRPAVAEAPELGISLSHASGHVAAGAAYGPMGVDLEPIVPGRADPALTEAVLGDAELAALDSAPDRTVAFLRQWVRREALVKVGAVSLDTLRTVDLSRLPPGEPSGGWAAHRWDRFVLSDWRSDQVLGAIAAFEPVELSPLVSVAGSLR